MSSIKYKTEDGYISVPLNIIGSRVYLEDYDDGEVIPELIDDTAKLGIGIGTCSTSSGNELEVTLSGYKLVKNGLIAVTFTNDVPAGATLNVNDKGAKPIFNKGAAIDGSTIKADDTVMFAYDGTNYVVTSLGGSDITLPGFVNITLNQTDGRDSDLIGATIVITDDDTSETILSTTWQGEAISQRIADGIKYTVTVGNVAAYNTPSAQSKTAVEAMIQSCVFTYENSYYVDLGLPSGILWAKRNIDVTQSDGFAASEFQYECSFFSWGNAVGYNPINTSFNYDFGSENTGPYASTPGAQLTGNAPVSATYDIARAVLGEPWRLPTENDFIELRDNTYFVQADGITAIESSVTNKIVTVNNVDGVYLKSKINGNLLFFPKCGCAKDTSLINTGIGYYWSSTLKDSNNGSSFHFQTQFTGFDHGNVRYRGYNCKAVC